jgi:hypothetical protein
MGREPCSWCEHPIFGLFGLADTSGPKTVEGFYYPRGEGFEEVCGGWAERGYMQTRMCAACTFERVRMVSCTRHRMRELDPRKGEIDERVWDQEAWTKSMDALADDDEVGGELFLNARWCSVCPNLAKFMCCAKQSFSADGGEDGGVGCGLLLCGECEELLGKFESSQPGGVSGGESLDAVVGERTRYKLFYGNGVRADAEFLTSDGELMVRIRQGMGGFGREDGDEDDVDSPKRCMRDKGKAKDMSFFSPPPRPVLHTPLQLQSRTWREETKSETKGLGGTWMCADNPKMTFSGKIEKEAGMGMGVGMKGEKRQAINFGEEVRASGKGKERSRWFDREKGVWGEVEVTVLSDDDD